MSTAFGSYSRDEGGVGLVSKKEGLFELPPLTHEPPLHTTVQTPVEIYRCIRIVVGSPKILSSPPYTLGNLIHVGWLRLLYSKGFNYSFGTSIYSRALSSTLALQRASRSFGAKKFEQDVIVPRLLCLKKRYNNEPYIHRIKFERYQFTIYGS